MYFGITLATAPTTPYDRNMATDSLLMFVLSTAGRSIRAAAGRFAAWCTDWRLIAAKDYPETRDSQSDVEIDDGW
jgi:hypothetical protein